jgi:hypothetical protein
MRGLGFQLGAVETMQERWPGRGDEVVQVVGEQADDARAEHL